MIGVDAAFYGFDESEVLSQCALQMIRKVDAKCGADAFSTMLQANKSALMSSLQASASVYRNLVRIYCVYAGVMVLAGIHRCLIYYSSESLLLYSTCVQGRCYKFCRLRVITL